MSKYGDRNWNWVEALINKMGGLERAESYLRGELVLVESCVSTWPIWRRINLGTGLKTKQDFYRAISSAGCEISRCFENLFSYDLEKEISRGPVVVDLLLPSVAELGFEEGQMYDIVCSRALQYGFRKCTAEVGLQLRLQYLTQREGERLSVVMDPIQEIRRDGISTGNRAKFIVEHEDGGLLRLDCDFTGGDRLLKPDDRLVFMGRVHKVS